MWIASQDPVLAWRRRAAFAAGVLAIVASGALPLAWGITQEGWSVLRAVCFGLFALMLGQIAYGFTLAAGGWWLLKTGRDGPRITDTMPAGISAARLSSAAVVMPIFNEEVDRVFQGLQVMYESLQRTGQGDAFDFFILSDSTDPNVWIAEERAWFELCKRVGGFGRIFYRKRRLSVHYKSGNIADFCRRWGARYRYMIVLDADSVMTGKTMARLAALMDQNPEVGIIQTSARLALGRGLFQRISQFANSVYGPIFAAGANAWQLGNANFWGHNAIVRLKPFIKHCAMPEMPRSSPLGARVLSHDTIEAAFMRRAGYEVWCAYDLEESYEEAPPHALASLRRDRRWCHGNLQHLWFLFAPRLTWASRANILLGILSYVSAPLWLLFILLSAFAGASGMAADETVQPVLQNGCLFAGVLILLLLPKALGVMLILRSPEKRRAFGGAGKVLVSALFETLFSALYAPVLMLFYARFVISSFASGTVSWGPQQRTDQEGPSWSQWFAVHGVHMALALVLTGLVARFAPSVLPWLVPVLAGPILAVPFSRLTASSRLGRQAREKGLFLAPEEISPPAELEKIKDAFGAPTGPFFQSSDYARDYGLLQAVLDPYVNSIHVSLLRQRSRASARTREYLANLRDRLLRDGPIALTPREKRLLLWDGDAMLSLHQKLWSSPASGLHQWWQAAFRHYNETSALDIRRSVSAI